MSNSYGFTFNKEDCTYKGVPCDCKDCAIFDCRELECSICCGGDEYWRKGRCARKYVHSLPSNEDADLVTLLLSARSDDISLEEAHEMLMKLNLVYKSGHVNLAVLESLRQIMYTAAGWSRPDDDRDLPLFHEETAQNMIDDILEWRVQGDWLVKLKKKYRYPDEGSVPCKDESEAGADNVTPQHRYCGYCAEATTGPREDNE